MVSEWNYVHQNVFSLQGDWMKLAREIFLSNEAYVFLPKDVAYNLFGFGVS